MPGHTWGSQDCSQVLILSCHLVGSKMELNLSKQHKCLYFPSHLVRQIYLINICLYDSRKKVCKANSSWSYVFSNNINRLGHWWYSSTLLQLTALPGYYVLLPLISSSENSSVFFLGGGWGKKGCFVLFLVTMANWTIIRKKPVRRVRLFRESRIFWYENQYTVL